MTRSRTAVFAITTLVLVPTAAAQTQPAPAASIETAVSIGKNVEVNIRPGRTLKGRVFAVSPTTLDLMTSGRKETIAVADIWMVQMEYRDRLTDGAKKGALTGLVIGAGLGVLMVASSCGGRDFLDFCTAGGFLLWPSLIGGYAAGIGAAAGLIGDALQSSTHIVWHAPTTSSRVSVGLLTGAGRTGARVVISW
jgi:hypothetical protein